MEVLPSQLPWWVAGPGVGLCVVGLYALAGLRLGVSGSWLQLVEAAGRRRVREPWRLWFLVGLVGGAVTAAVLGTARSSGYGDLGELLPVPALLAVLLATGVLIGYGARWAGGCTSGHGISGCSAGSPDSLATTATFFVVAILTTLLVHVFTGGAV